MSGQATGGAHVAAGGLATGVGSSSPSGGGPPHAGGAIPELAWEKRKLLAVL